MKALWSLFQVGVVESKVMREGFLIYLLNSKDNSYEYQDTHRSLHSVSGQEIFAPQA